MTYIAKALREFRNGARPSGFMRLIAAALSESEIESVAHYYSAQPPASRAPPAVDPAPRDKGTAIAQPGSMRSGPACLICHALNSLDRAPDIPPLSGQSARYLAEQLMLFRSGVRGQTSNARVMARIANGLSDEDVKAVTTYFATLPIEGEEQRISARHAE
jgi:cytochrome c553